MKALKKILSLLTAAALCAAILSGCGSESSSAPDGADQADSSSESVSDSMASSVSDSSSDADDEEIELNYSEGLDENGLLTGVHALDYVTLPEDYAAVPVPAEEVEVTDEEVQEVIDSNMEGFGEPEQITDRAIEDGEYVNIDYSGSIDGVKFDGGTAAGQRVLAGSAMFIDDFLTQIIGHKPGETFDVEVTFPDPYENNPDLAGKDAVFSVTINYIEGEAVIPDFTDAFIAENLGELGWENVADARADIAKELHDTKLNNYVWSYVYDNAQVSEVPQEAVDFQHRLYRNQITTNLQSQASSFGMSVEDILSAQGIESIDALVEQAAEDVELGAKQMIIMQAMAEDQALTVTDENLSDYFFENFGTDDYSSFEDAYGRPYLCLVHTSEQLNTMLMENASVVRA